MSDPDPDSGSESFELEPDPDYIPTYDGEPVAHVAFIRTSDRSTFRRCRRKFGWSNIHRGNRTSRSAKAPLWFGTGFHYALEDYHGYRHFSTARGAFEAYVDASQRVRGIELPPDLPELITLGQGMCDYYETWLATRDPGRTLVVDGIPQVEVRFQIEIPIEPDYLRRCGFDKCVYVGTIDRVILDEYNRIWLCDYKTAKIIRRDHLDLDGQITAYCWAANQIYNYPVAGFVYQQHKKSVPHPPAWTTSSKMFSVSKTQNTTYSLYKAALVNMYGAAEKAPPINIQFLNKLAEEETQRADKIIARDFINRNQHHIDMEGWKILSEAEEMLDRGLILYPNPTRDCSWDCDFKAACLNLDEGADWEFELQNSTIDRTEEDLSWRTQLQLPLAQQLSPEQQLFLPQPHRRSRKMIRRQW